VVSHVQLPATVVFCNDSSLSSTGAGIEQVTDVGTVGSLKLNTEIHEAL